MEDYSRVRLGILVEQLDTLNLVPGQRKLVVEKPIRMTIEGTERVVKVGDTYDVSVFGAVALSISPKWPELESLVKTPTSYVGSRLYFGVTSKNDLADRLTKRTSMLAIKLPVLWNKLNKLDLDFYENKLTSEEAKEALLDIFRDTPNVYFEEANAIV